jgi:predicted nucleic acid-binding protein
MYCIDTNIFVEFLRGNKEIIKRFNEAYSEDIFVSPITLCELFQGAYLSSNPESKIKEINDFIGSFDLLSFDKDVCEEFGRQYSELAKSGKMIPEFDLIIGCFAKINNLILITRDKKHFENIGIKAEVW